MNILIQHHNTKFINNIADSRFDSHNIYFQTINNNLYKLHYLYKIDMIFFVESLLSTEILQYIAEFFQSVKIVIYHDRVPNKDIIDSYKNHCIHLVNRGFTKIPYTKELPTLLNTSLYNEHKILKTQKQHHMVCFLDGLDTLPQNINDILYPKSQIKIKLFNNYKIPHPQNIGMISEKDKANILSESEYFLALDDSYVLEAILSGCVVITPEEIIDNGIYQPIKYIKKSDYISYQDFMESIL